MKVLLVNTSERTGGAALAAGRLMKALNGNDIRAKMLVRDKETAALTVIPLPWTSRLGWSFLWERLVVLLHLHGSRKRLFEIDVANAGTDITGLREFKEADVIHLHWINQGMLSLGGIRKILRSGKPVVWTMHDIWPATGICHLPQDCRRFEVGCGCCRLLPGGGSMNDLAARVWRRKQRMLQSGSIYYVACSSWLESEARRSALLAGQKITSIPNPIDTHIYHPGDKLAARQRLGLPADKRLVLFASQRASNRLKGMDYLIEACRRLRATGPDVALVVLGGHAEEMLAAFDFPIEAYPLGYVNDEQRIVDVYQAADVFVLPSLSENLPNTIMEAMACGVPCVAFRVGGIPEEIDHMKNGYVADYCSGEDLARGISWVLTEADYDSLSCHAVQKVAQCYSQRSVAMRYREVYQEMLDYNLYRL